MAPVEIDQDPSFLPTLQIGGHILLTICLTALVSRTMYRSYLALPPSSATRHRQHLRRDHVKIFISLALLGLITAGWFGVSGASLSYRVWAAERGVELPDSFFGDKGAFRLGQHPGRFDIIRWLNDTPFYRDNLEIVAENAKYFWWGQQASFAMNSFSTYVAIEGRRRNISNLWAFILLGQLVNVSFAQNLWFVAILLTPVPLPENVDILTDTRRAFGSVHKLWFEKIVPQRANNWLPSSGFYIALLLFGHGAMFLTPFAANTSSFGKIALLSVSLPFAPLLLPYVIPEHWGTTYDHPHKAHSSCMGVFRSISVISSILHFRTTGLALLHNTPENHYYRHSILHPLEKIHRSNTNRIFKALERVLGSIADHPAVGSVGYDVLLSGLSLGTWSAIRALDGNEILRVVIPWMNKSSTGVKVKEEVESTAKSTDISPLRRRGRPRKSTKSQQDTTYVPTPSTYAGATEGDQDGDEDWEISALTWGIVSAAGLGVGSAAVYGAEMTAR